MNKKALRISVLMTTIFILMLMISTREPFFSTVMYIPIFSLVYFNGKYVLETKDNPNMPPISLEALFKSLLIAFLWIMLIISISLILERLLGNNLWLK
ncbi:hypothetical protein [Orenia marismortui]|uniref:hypothetical protein n=1 Tax=Orenia marismortui TaxID=46469 RepID=UPI00035CD1B0|nr:hypothetical protein [Orenia marismortui]